MKIKSFIVDGFDGLRSCSTSWELLSEVRSILDMDDLVGPIAVQADNGDVYVVDVSLIPLEDSREELQEYVEQIIEETKDVIYEEEEFDEDY